jgi:hypothetical protein
VAVDVLALGVHSFSQLHLVGADDLFLASSFQGFGLFFFGLFGQFFKSFDLDLVGNNLVSKLNAQWLTVLWLAISDRSLSSNHKIFSSSCNCASLKKKDSKSKGTNNKSIGQKFIELIILLFSFI